MIYTERLLAFTSYTYNSLSFKLTLVYLLMVICSRTWKNNTKPLQLNKLMTVYNYGMSAANAICCGMFAWSLLQCDRFYSKQRSVQVEQAAILYWLLKVAELMDTVFMVLRHRHRQISFLHVYHHASMVLLTDYFCHLAPWPAIAFVVMLNSFVHVCLYAYYGMASSSVTVPAETKQRMTQLQLAQFGIGLVHVTVGYVYHDFCGYSILYCLTMIALFGNFYRRAYGTRRAGKKEW